MNASDQSMREFMALEAELKQGRTGSRITQGIPTSTMPLDEALQAVRGQNRHGILSFSNWTYIHFL